MAEAVCDTDQVLHEAVFDRLFMLAGRADIFRYNSVMTEKNTTRSLKYTKTADI